jgi:hypothetical protein
VTDPEQFLAGIVPENAIDAAGVRESLAALRG